MSSSIPFLAIGGFAMALGWLNGWMPFSEHQKPEESKPSVQAQGLINTPEMEQLKQRLGLKTEGKGEHFGSHRQNHQRGQRRQREVRGQKPSGGTSKLYNSEKEKSPFAGMSDQAISNKIAADLGIKTPPTIVYGCSYNGKSGFAGLAAYQENKIVICPSGNPTSVDKEFTIAHENGHYLQYQRSPDLKEFSEPFADRTAIDYFDRIGYLAPVEGKANDGNGGAYAAGREYAKNLLKEKKNERSQG